MISQTRLALNRALIDYCGVTPVSAVTGEIGEYPNMISVDLEAAESVRKQVYYKRAMF